MGRRNLGGAAAAVAAASFSARHDGGNTHPAPLWDVKPPAQSRGAGDHHTFAATTLVTRS